LGFLRKDVAMGMLGTLFLSGPQLVVASTVLATFFPCLATAALLFRELGIKGALFATSVMLSISLTAGTILNIIF
jgi:ferrous iron transport protein B